MAAARDVSDAVTLHNGVKMPWLGLGTWKSAEGAEVERAVRAALDLGYRHVDTAAVYGNERGVGRAVLESGVPREQVFVTTKVWNDAQRAGPATVKRAFDESLRRLDMDYVDLYLVHWPVKGKYKDAWRALEEIYATGRAKAIGVSNFMVHHLNDLLAVVDVVPMVNQVEFHPRLLQRELLELCRQNDIIEVAWSPLMRGKVEAIRELRDVAEKYGKTPAQVVLRWDLQHGVATIPKSVRRERLSENAEIFDFALSPQDMATIDSLERGQRTGPDPDNFTF